MTEVERPEAAAVAEAQVEGVASAVDAGEAATTTPAEETGVLSPEELRAKAILLHGEVFRRDFAYPTSDPRHWCLPYEGARDGDQSGSDGEYGIDQSMDAFDDSTSSLGSNFSTGWGRNKETVEVNCNQLLADLDLAKMLEAKLILHQFTFAKARAMYEFQGVTEWEMTVREGEWILLLDRREVPHMLSEEDAEMSKNLLSPYLANIPEPLTSTVQTTPEDRTASIDSPKPLPSVAIYLRPRSFALDLDRFLDYRRLYPDGWSLGLKVKIKVKGRVNRRINAQGKTKVRLDKDGKLRVRVKLVDKGLVPTNYVDTAVNGLEEAAEGTPTAEAGADEQPQVSPEDAAAQAEGGEDRQLVESPQSNNNKEDMDVPATSQLDDLADNLAPLSVETSAAPKEGASGETSEEEEPVVSS